MKHVHSLLNFLGDFINNNIFEDSFAINSDTYISFIRKLSIVFKILAIEIE